MSEPSPRRTPVLLAAAGAAWEVEAVRTLERTPDLVLQARCVDAGDLLAAAATGLARCAVVADALAGLDSDLVDRLGRLGVGVVAVADLPADSAARARLARLGVGAVVGPGPEGLAAAVQVATADPRASAAEEPVSTGSLPGPGRAGQVVVVWGPTGAPGRTTVATALATESARRRQDTLLVDADPYGGAVAQHLGILDEVSGLLAAARLANAGALDGGSLASVARRVEGGLRVLTGLPRPDRWPEVRPAAVAALLDHAGRVADRVVVDVGFSLEDPALDPFSAAPRRNETTLCALERADDVVVVGSADPVGLARLVRGVVELREVAAAAAVHVVVNRTRPTLAWSPAEVGSMLEGLVRPVGIHYLPEDRAGADRALAAGRSVVEGADSPLRRAVGPLADSVFGRPPAPGARRAARPVRTRRAARGRRR